MKKIFYTLLISLFVATSSFAGDESSHVKTILPGSSITFGKEIIIKANETSFTIGRREYQRANGSYYLGKSISLYVNSSVPYDRKISTGKKYIVSDVKSDAMGTLSKTYIAFDNGTYIACYGWENKIITIGDLRSFLSENEISLELNVPEL
jgi:hypothetical protein